MAFVKLSREGTVCQWAPPASSETKPLAPKELISPFLGLAVNMGCMQIVKVFLLLQLLSPPCLVNFNKNPRQVLSIPAALPIRCQSPYMGSCPLGVHQLFPIWLPVACSFSPFVERGFGGMQIRWVVVTPLLLLRGGRAGATECSLAKKGPHVHGDP